MEIRIIFICDICDREFETKRGLSSHRRWHDPEFRENHRKKTLGKTRSEEFKKKMSEIAKKRIGKKSPMFGKHHSEETKKKMSESNKGKKSFLYGKFGDEHPKWKGDNVGYDGLHKYIDRYKPKPEKCELCGLPGKLELSNITGKLIRDIDNFQYVHHSCHFKYDFENKIIHEGF